MADNVPASFTVVVAEAWTRAFDDPPLVNASPLLHVLTCWWCHPTQRKKSWGVETFTVTSGMHSAGRSLLVLKSNRWEVFLRVKQSLASPQIVHPSIKASRV